MRRVNKVKAKGGKKFTLSHEDYQFWMNAIDLQEPGEDAKGFYKRIAFESGDHEQMDFAYEQERIRDDHYYDTYGGGTSSFADERYGESTRVVTTTATLGVWAKFKSWFVGHFDKTTRVETRHCDACGDILGLSPGRYYDLCAYCTRLVANLPPTDGIAHVEDGPEAAEDIDAGKRIVEDMRAEQTLVNNKLSDEIRDMQRLVNATLRLCVPDEKKEEVESLKEQIRHLQRELAKKKSEAVHGVAQLAESRFAEISETDKKSVALNTYELVTTGKEPMMARGFQAKLKDAKVLLTNSMQHLRIDGAKHTFKLTRCAEGSDAYTGTFELTLLKNGGGICDNCDFAIWEIPETDTSGNKWRPTKAMLLAPVDVSTAIHLFDAEHDGDTTTWKVTSATATTPGYYRYAVDTRVGSSGSPVFQRTTANGELRVVGLHCGGATEDRKGFIGIGADQYFH